MRFIFVIFAFLMSLPLVVAQNKEIPMVLSVDDYIIVSQDSVKSTNPDDIINSNISFINALLGKLLKEDEVSSDALTSYYVDYYLAQVNNGGFGQYIYNMRANPTIIKMVREGLEKIGATKNLALYDRSLKILTDLGEDRVARFLISDYFGDNAERDALDKHIDEFYALQKQESLTNLNAAWLKKHPKLKALSIDDMRQEIDLRAKAIPDIEERMREAEENAPDYVKRINALCKKAGQIFDRITTGDPSHEYNGKTILAWHFLTDKGHHFMIEEGGKAIMFNGTTKEKVDEITLE